MTEHLHPLPPLEERPLVTFALFAYNQEKYICEAVEGALAQTYEPLEIILSDDSSTDNTFQVMVDMVEKYTGPHKITLNRNNQNLGLIAHVNYVNELANGDLIVAAAGDDISLPHRTAVHAGVFFGNFGKVHSIHSSVMKIDEDSKDLGLWTPPILNTKGTPEELVDKFGLIIGASHSWSRKLNEIFGPIQYGEAYEDMVIAFRSSLLKGVYYVDEPLVRYRYGIGISDNNKNAPKNAKTQIQKMKKFNVVCLAATKQRIDDSIVIQSAALTIALKKQMNLIRIKIRVLTMVSYFPEMVVDQFFGLVKAKRLIAKKKK